MRKDLLKRFVSIVIVANFASTMLLASPSRLSESGTTLMDQVVATANLEAMSLHPQPQSGSTPPIEKRSKLKAALIGAAIGGGVGAVYGTVYCSADCGGGRPRGATVFGSIGAGIGAVGGLVVALIPSP